MRYMKQALKLFTVMLVLTGAIYPIVVTLPAKTMMPSCANGSLVRKDGKIVGSYLIGQNFTEPKYFWGRPSATAEIPYNAASSGGSNLGPISQNLIDTFKERIDQLTKSGVKEPIPADLVMASSSGLDPHITPEAAYAQVARIAAARGKSENEIRELIARNIEKRFLLLLGKERVNVLKLNFELDTLK